ncbi:protein of unknown function [Paraburkholderia kururiensis]
MRIPPKRTDRSTRSEAHAALSTHSDTARPAFAAAHIQWHTQRHIPQRMCRFFASMHVHASAFVRPATRLHAPLKR